MSEKPDLVERRRRYIQHQIELDKGAVNVLDAAVAELLRQIGKSGKQN